MKFLCARAPPLAYLRAVLVKRFFEINNFTKLVERPRNNPGLASLCGFGDPPSEMGFSRFMKRLSETERARKREFMNDFLTGFGQ